MNEENCKKIRDLLEKISENPHQESQYYKDKQTLSKIFDMKITEDIIRVRLTVLDSMYSTRMGMFPYGLEGLKNALWEECYKNGKGSELKGNLDAIVRDPGNPVESIKNLFAWKYGIKANNAKAGKEYYGENGAARAVSLISKYFYFETKYNFPIYDSIVLEYLPVMCCFCDVHRPSLSENDIFLLIKAINKFFEDIEYTEAHKNYGNRYDSLDHLLWMIGKIIRGNLSLVLSGGDFKTIIETDAYKKIPLREKKEDEKKTKSGKYLEIEKALKGSRKKNENLLILIDDDCKNAYSEYIDEIKKNKDEVFVEIAEIAKGFTNKWIEDFKNKYDKGNL